MKLPEPTFVDLPAKTLVGTKVEMSFLNNKTRSLWQGFMPRRNEVQNRVDELYYSLQVYPDSFFKGGFNPMSNFTKYALVEVSSTENIPEGFEVFNLEAGTYAVFNFKGKSSDAVKFFMRIFQKWLPKSGRQLEARPQFERMGKAYKPDSVSEEEIWIPVKP